MNTKHAAALVQLFFIISVPVMIFWCLFLIVNGVGADTFDSPLLSPLLSPLETPGMPVRFRLTTPPAHYLPGRPRPEPMGEQS